MSRENFAPRIIDTDHAYAVVAGLDREEQRLLLRALLEDMRPVDIRDTLGDLGWTHVNPLRD